MFRTNVDDIVTAGPHHALRFAVEPESGGLKPYLMVRGRLEAVKLWSLEGVSDPAPAAEAAAVAGDA